MNRLRQGLFRYGYLKTAAIRGRRFQFAKTTSFDLRLGIYTKRVMGSQLESPRCDGPRRTVTPS